MKNKELDKDTQEVEIDMSGFSIDGLLFIIKDMHENNMTFNEWACEVLKRKIEEQKCNSACDGEKKTDEAAEGFQGEML